MPDPVHIAMLLTNPYRPDPRVQKEAHSLARAGYRVTVICWDRQDEFPPMAYDGDVEIRRLVVRSGYGVGSRQMLYLPRFWWRALAEFRRLKPDAVHCHDFDTLPVGLFWGKINKRPVIYDAHEYYADLVRPRLRGLIGNILYRMIQRAEKIGTRLASAVVTVDETLAAVYRKYNQTVLVVGHYPRARLVSQPTPVFTRPELTMLYIGRLSKDRGLLVYVELLRILCRQGIPARLCLVGAFLPPSEEQRFKEHCQGIEDRVEVVGWIHYDDISAQLQRVDVGLAVLQPEPRYVAAVPVKLFEYMAAGLPVVISNFPPVASIVTETRCGVLVDPLDPQMIADQIVEWWKHPAKPQSYGQNGFNAVKNKYNWNAHMQKLVDQYSYLTQS